MGISDVLYKRKYWPASQIGPVRAEIKNDYTGKSGFLSPGFL